MPPVFQTSTYVHPGLDQLTEWDYARSRNPTTETLERNVATLEGGVAAVAFSSGLAAIEAVMKRLSAGDHVVCEENTYGGTHRMFVRILSRLGLEFSFVDTREPENVSRALTSDTKLVLLETPTNPLMRIADIQVLAGVAHDAGALLVVDNTFASPFNQRPLEMGADVVVHSATKYLNGHSDLVGGIVVVGDESLDEEIRFLRMATGAVPGPWDAWLCLRGTKTLHLRMEAHNRNGMAVAHFLEEHPAVERVFYPGLESHPQHELAASQMHGFSGMVSVEMGSRERAKALVEGTRTFALAESLGGVESLISVPALMTHASVPEERRKDLGITEGLVRLSVGVEDQADLIRDLERALEE